MGRPVFPDPHPLLRFRAACDLSLRALARKTRLDFRRLSTIERGLSRTEIRHLAVALGCQPEDLRPPSPI